MGTGHRYRNLIIPVGHIRASQQVVRGRENVISDVKPEVHNAGDDKCEIRVFPSCLWANYNRELALRMGQK